MSVDKASRTRLLRDSPADEDSFGGHARVAAALADVIQHDVGGQTLGLEGGWGSGKSTIVRLLRDGLPEDVNVFVFDAWAHEGDPLRRSFLESLINNLIERGWVSQESWDDERDRLAGRQRETKTATSQQLTDNGRLLTGSVFLVPLGSALLAWILRHEKVNPVEVLLAALVAVAPLVVAIVLVIHSKISNDKKGDPLAIFSKTTTSNQPSLTIESPDPTSLEFEAVFGLLLAEALSDESRQILIVLDNLDRVGPATSGRTLATLQTFTDFRERLSVAGRCWVLLPYDKEGLAGLWEDNVERQLDKIVQSRFYVPPILPADWRSHLRSLLSEAMPGRSEADLASAHSTVIAAQVEGEWPSSVEGEIGLPPSPRDMVTLVNDLGALNREWLDMPLAILAYYAILRREGTKDIPVELAHGKSPSTRVSSVLGSQAADYLAAVHFCVPIDRSRHVLIGEPLSLALRSGRVKEVKEFSGFEGFWEVVRDLPFAEWNSDGRNDLALAVAALHESGLLAQAPEPVKSALVNGARGDDREWRPGAVRSGRGLGELVMLDPDGGLLDEVLEHYDVLAPDQDEDVKRRAAAGFVGFSLTLASHNADAQLTIDADAHEFVGLCARLGRLAEHDRAIEMLDPVVDAGQVAEVVAEWAGEQPSDARSAAVVEVLLERDGLIDCVRAAEGYTTAISGVGAAANSAFKSTTDILYLLASASPVDLMTLAEDGSLLDLVGTFAPGGDLVTAAKAAVLHLAWLPALPEPPGKGNASSGVGLVRSALVDGQASDLGSEIAKLLAADEGSWAFVIARRAEDVPPLVADVIRAEPVASALDAGKLCEDWQVLNSVLSQDALADAVARTFSGLARMLSTTGAVPAAAEALMLGMLDDVPVPEREIAVEAWQERLAGLSTGEWSDELQGSGPSMDVLARLHDLDRAPLLGVAFQEALIVLGGQLARHETSGPSLPWLPSLLSEAHQRDAVAEKVVDQMAANSANPSMELVEVFGDLLRGSSALLGNDRLLSGIAADAVRAGDGAFLDWLASEVEQHPEVPALRDGAKVENLRELVLDALRSDPSAPAGLEALARSLGVPWPEDEETADEAGSEENDQEA